MSFLVQRLCLLPATLLAVALAGCGGGGGGEGPPPLTARITVQNRDVVASVATSTAFGLGTADVSLGVSIAMQRRVAQRVGTAKKRPLALLGPFVESCGFSGDVSVSLDDRDNDGSPSVGDVLTLQFNACRESADELLNGRVDATYTGISPPPNLGVGARIAMTALSAEAPDHFLRLDGTLAMSYGETGAGVATTRLVADGPVGVRVISPILSDTVTVHSGFFSQSVFDPSVAPPPGGVNFGRSRLTQGGTLTSSAAGGTVDVVTDVTFVQYADDANPRSGVLRVLGQTGALRVVALSSDFVRVEVDADEDGTFENAVTVDWDFLL